MPAGPRHWGAVRSNGTPHADARMNGMLCKVHGARAGERGR